LIAGANASVKFSGKTAQEWAFDNGDYMAVALLQRVSLFLLLCTPRALSRTSKRITVCGLKNIPSELMIRLEAMLFRPLFQLPSFN
jgi:hypothetical protein